MECVVQGILEAKHVDALEVLLQGLCGGLRETIKVHEICLKTGPNLGAVASEVHLCCSLSQPEPVWSVRHVGGAMRGAGAEQLPALVRPVLEAGISNNSLRFMHALGYKLDYEMLRTGFSFQMHKTVPIAVTITIAVTAIHRLPKTHSVDEAQPVTPNLHMVQLTAPASPDNYSDVVGAISGLAEYLAPLVHLSKPGVPAGVVPTASTAAAALISRGGITKVL
ncbi:hypothetical protein KC19_2G159700 [Ceratodon purpureus]|uniref:Mediator of RNA polymerase II transcription subunit 18 n=1 Tax=Ceratodon purpureus TaxID=3225 RepID=A0A8T0IWQ4_CERPU|nr:hypothetical protein KC19_2G159700 [Ceratodon purpureus]